MNTDATMDHVLSAVVLLSGGGTTMQNLVERGRTGRCRIDVRAVLSSRADAYGLERARRLGIPTHVVERKDFSTVETFSAEIFALAEPYHPDVIVMAGFLSLLRLPGALIGRVVNVHPALLPKFGGKGMYGIYAHRAVIAAGERESGCTVHFVNNEYDRGPIILQRRVPVLSDDTPENLQERVQAAEREAYPEAINLLAEGKARYAE